MRHANTKSILSHLQVFVLGHVRDNGPLTSADFSNARRGELPNGSEWAMNVLRALERHGLVFSAKCGNRTHFTITPSGRAEIADLGLVPGRLAAFPDREGKSVALASTRSWLGPDPQELSIHSVINGMGIIEPLDAVEMAEATRILKILKAEKLERARSAENVA